MQNVMIPRKEHPKPQFVRKDWLNLNGKWKFDFDQSRSGIERGLFKEEVIFSKEITVPFCPQSELSGINYKDFIYGVWYKREFELTEEQAAKRTVIHFGAVDYKSFIYINGQKAGEHVGGYVSFSFDISKYVRTGKNTVTVYAEDDERDHLIPVGKQCEKFYSCGCSYTRTTGIWQTVWLEFTPLNYIKNFKFYPDVNNSAVTVEAEICGVGELNTTVLYDNKIMAQSSLKASKNIRFTLNLSEKHLWEIGNGRLYDVEFKFGEDVVKSYFGLREVELKDGKFLLNGESVFQRLVLDQGFYPDGIYTAPTDEELKNDILRSLSCGFNGARLHEKVFEERFLYHADTLGYLVWGEYPDWGVDFSNPLNIYSFFPEWTAEIERDFNHPSIIGWCPHNETWNFEGRQQFDESIRMLYKITKLMDNTRSCIDTSGNYHVETDIFDVHNYSQNPVNFKAHYDKLANENVLCDALSERQKYNGEPVMISEYGGIKWSNEEENAWGYGEAPKTEEEFIERFKGLAEAILNNKRMIGLCYTQLTDVEQEQNGLYTYDRRPKFDPEIFRKILSRKAAIED